MRPGRKPTEKQTGRIEEPRFVRGFDPEMHIYHPPPFVSPWNRHFELCRQNPAVWSPATQRYEGGWMLVSEVKKGGGPRARTRIIETDRMKIKNYLAKYHPRERWQTRVCTVSGTWYDRELYLRYLHTLSEEEHILDRKRAREHYEAQQAMGRERKARQALEARQKAQREEAEAQVRIRARQKPGG